MFGMAALVFTLLVFAVIGLACLKADPAPSYAGFALSLAIFAFFLWGLLRVIRRLRDPKAQLILDDEGVTDRTMPTPKFLWQSILAAQVIQTRRFGVPMMTLVRLDVTDEQERLDRLSSKDRRLVAMNRSMGYGTFFVNLTSLPIRGEDFFRLMNERRAQQSLPALIDGIRTVPVELTR